MNQKRNQTKVVNVFTVFMVMLILYFIVGLFTVINQQFQIPLQTAMLPHDGNITNALVTMLNFSWFLAYPLSEGFGTRWLEKYGYRKTSYLALLILIAGLAIYEAAVLFHIYTPMQVSIIGNHISVGFFIFLIGSFVIGVAATILQVVLNLYLTVCRIGKTTALQLMLIITILVGKTQMPSIDNVRQVPGEKFDKSVWSFRNLKLGVWGIFFYVGIEVAVGANVNMYASELGGSFASNATHMAALYWGLLLLGRFLGSFIKQVPSEKQLVIASIGAIVLLVLAMLMANPWILTLIGFFHSIMWPAIFTLATDQLGKYTTKASGVLTMGVIGGGIIPLLQGIFADVMGGNWLWTWLLVIAGEAYILYYGLNGYKQH